MFQLMSKHATVLLHHLEFATKDVGFYVDGSKTEFIGFKQWGWIQTFSSELIKAVESFTYVESEKNSTEKCLRIRTAEGLLKSDLSDKLKQGFFYTTVEIIIDI